MNKVNTLFKKWDNVVKKYEIASDKIQKEISKLLTDEIISSDTPIPEIRSFLDESGKN